MRSGLFNSFIIAFSMYSKIPMPKREWTEENMRYSLVFFPFVGAAIGLFLCAWIYIAHVLDIGNILRAAVSACIPLVISGGIHMDGFCDTSDALSSNQPREKKLEILKDSNSGAFAIIKSCMWFLLYFAAFTQLTQKGVYIVALGYIISRAFSGISVLNFKSARPKGLAAAFKDTANIRTVTRFLSLILCITAVAMLWLSPVMGGTALFISILVFACYRWMSYRKFGGVTGDLAGWFLVQCEIWLIFGVIFAERILNLWF